MIDSATVTYAPNPVKTRKTYNKIATSLKYLYVSGFYSGKELRNLGIAPSTYSSWRNTDFSRYLCFKLDSGLTPDELKMILSNKKLRAILRVSTTIIKIFSKISKKSLFSGARRFKDLVITTITKARDSLKLDLACRFFHISPSTFHSWSKQVKNKCLDSTFNLCLRIWPNQLTKTEVNAVKTVCSDPSRRGWPLIAFYYRAFRDNLISFSLNTFYKYAACLGLSRITPKKKRYPAGIRADAPNKVWHLDVMKFKTMDNKWSFIHILVDNFSRMILAYRVSLKLEAANTLSCLREAYYKYIDNTPLSEHEPVLLISDGGAENTATEVKTYLSTVPIKQLIAQKDISFSNSMVEAVNKSLKYNSFFQANLIDHNALVKHLAAAIPEFNSERPLGVLEGLTPEQAYNGEKIDMQIVRTRLDEAAKRRIRENQDSKCVVCTVE
ncbi:MAG: transposase family protein [Spirochaetales bacterium]|nr:transposase family protein [Spirochaetales bacterium]